MTEKNKLSKSMLIGIPEADPTQAAISVSPNMDAATAFQLVGTLTSHLMKTYLAIAKANLSAAAKYSTSPTAKLTDKEREAAITGIKDSIYDAVNNVFSNVLQDFEPNSPINDIEEEAIRELVNAKVQAKYDKLSKAEKAKYREAYNKLKLNAEYRANTANTQKEADINEDTSGN